MKRIRGGERLKWHQYSNDWISADGENGGQVIVSPLAVEFDDDAEVDRFLAQSNTGTFWQEFELGDNRRFKRRPADPRVSVPQ